MKNSADKSQRKGLIAMLAACIILVAGGGPAYRALKGTGHDDTNGQGANLSMELTDGEYISELSGSGGETAETSVVSIKVVGGKIVACNWDIRDQNGVMKSQLSQDGQYIMTEDGMPWHDQSELLSASVVINGGDAKLETNEEGKLVDAAAAGVSGVSINISEFKAGVEACIREAGGTI